MMRKGMNGNMKSGNKMIIKMTIVSIFLFIIVSTLVLSDRKYLYIESCFKTLSSNINAYFIKKKYSNNHISSDVVVSKINALEEENNKLKKLLELKNNNEIYQVVEITKRAFQDYFKKIIVNKGDKDGIKKGNPVIAPNGLAGFVSKTSTNISEINLLTNVSNYNMISVLIEHENGLISGILNEYDNVTNLFKITDIVTKNEIKKNSIVTLSGYNNKLYRGIYIGKVVKEETNNYGLSKTVWIKSDVDFNDILYLLVIKEE